MLLDLALRKRLSGLTAVTVAAALALAPMSPLRAQENKGPPILRDTEAEALLREYTRPILRAAGLEKQNIQMVIINDPNFNAFVADGRRIFVNYGAIMQSETPNQLIGVLAHETGHLAGGHLAKLREQLVARPDANDRRHAARRRRHRRGRRKGTRYRRKRTCRCGRGRGRRSRRDDSAQPAVLPAPAGGKRRPRRREIPDRDRPVPKGMYDTFRRFTNDSLFAARGADPYLQSHPMPAERVAALEQIGRASPYWDKKDDPALQLRHDMMRAKISAFMERQDTVYRRYPAVEHQPARALCARDHHLSAWRSQQRAGPDRRADPGAAEQSVFLRAERPGAARGRQAQRGDRTAAQGARALQQRPPHRDVTWAGAGGHR